MNIEEKKVIFFCDTENKEIDYEYANKLIECFRKITGWKVLEGTRIHNDLMEFSKGYSIKKRPVEEVAYIFKIANGI